MADISEPSLPPAADASQADSMSRRPQLRLHHFFILTAVAAALMAFLGPALARWTETDIEVPKWLRLAYLILSMLYVFVIAAATTAMVYGVVWRRQGISFFDQPGHWLLVEIGALGILSMVPTVLAWRLFLSDDDTFSWTAFQFFWISSLVVMAGNLGVNTYSAWKKCREWRWKAVFLLMAVSSLSHVVQAFSACSILVMMALLAAVFRDRRNQVFRDSAHWCGVNLEFLSSTLALGSFGLSYLYSYVVQ
jgi:hypothetical protein